MPRQRVTGLLASAIVCYSLIGVLPADAEQLLSASSDHPDRVVIHRQGVDERILAQATQSDFRPCYGEPWGVPNSTVE